MSFKLLVTSALLATAMATMSESPFGQSQQGSYNQGGQAWTPWSGQQTSPQQAHPSLQPMAQCPAGCVPAGQAPPPVQMKPGELLVQVVSVADKNGSLKYFPNSVDAPVGSIVQFQFNPKNHTITESSFADPCKPIAANLTSSTRPGIRSGFIPVTGTEPFTPVFNVLINDTKPIWLFCGQVNHCQRGMAAVINPPKDSPNTIEQYIANAAKIPLVSVAAAAPPPASTSSVFAAPPPAATSSAFTFGAAPPAASSSTVGEAPIQTLASTTAAVAPATFTGAAAHLNVRDASTFGALVLGAAVALL